MLQERIELFGGPGSGKSYTWLSIARALPQSNFYCFDTDKAIERMLDKEFRGLKNVEIFDAQDWNACVEQLSVMEKSKSLSSEDWVIVDMVDSTWDYVQNYFVEEVFGMSIDEYFLQIRKALEKDAKSLDVFEGWVDWRVINKLYQKWINRICFQLLCHVLLTAKSTLVKPKDETALKSVFESFGMRPEGEKRMAHRVHTVIYCTFDRNGWYMTTIKDRGGRERLDRTPIKKFYIQYLCEIAGWEA